MTFYGYTTEPMISQCYSIMQCACANMPSNYDVKNAPVIYPMTIHEERLDTEKRLARMKKYRRTNATLKRIDMLKEHARTLKMLEFIDE